MIANVCGMSCLAIVHEPTTPRWRWGRRGRDIYGEHLHQLVEVPRQFAACANFIATRPGCVGYRPTARLSGSRTDLAVDSVLGTAGGSSRARDVNTAVLPFTQSALDT